MTENKPSRQVKVGILGQEYIVHTRADREHVEEVASYVTSRCREAQQSMRSSSQATILALAALNIASDYLHMKEAYDILLARIERQQRKLAKVVR